MEEEETQTGYNIYTFSNFLTFNSGVIMLEDYLHQLLMIPLEKIQKVPFNLYLKLVTSRFNRRYSN
jgi:hypothetical protein